MPVSLIDDGEELRADRRLFVLDPYSPKATSTSDADHPFEFLNHDTGEVPKMSERLAQLLHELNRKYEGNNQF